jgi:transcriptional regulatory protein RtcR
MTEKSRVAIGWVGAQLDQGKGPRRWEKWRPTVSLGQFDDLVFDRIELICQREFLALARKITDDLASVSPETTVVVHPVVVEDPWDFEEVWKVSYDLARSIDFDRPNEDWYAHITTGTHVAQICMYLLAESRHIPARLLQTGPITKRNRQRDDLRPGTWTVIDLDLGRYDAIASRFEQERQGGVSFLKDGIPTRNDAFNTLMDRMERVAVASDAPMLLTGPTGAGKTRLARRIYDLKRRRRKVRGEFVEVNCATLRGDGAMSALFGHKKGAFTGAISDRAGLLRAADGGLIFLDEIGELGLDEQAMLLRAIEEKVFVPMGSDREVSSDFQLLAGTNRDLIPDVRAGRFREDLFARVNLWMFRLPGLAERIEDLEPNLEFELELFARKQSRLVSFNRDARQRYMAFATGPDGLWRGNFRDLNASVTRMATLAPGARITEEVVLEELRRLRSDWRGAEPSEAPTDALFDVLTPEQIEDLDRFDRVQLADVVSVCRSSRSLSDAGRKLFSVSRSKKKSSNDADRLRKYLARHGLAFEDCLS